MFKGKKHLSIQNPWKIYFKNKDEIKTFSDTHTQKKPKEFVPVDLQYNI